MIPSRRPSTRGTLMPTLTQWLWDCCAAETALARTTRGDGHQLPPSFCRVVDQFCDERSPSGLIAGLGEPAAGQPFDVHILNRAHAISIDQGPSHLGLQIRALVLALGVSFVEQPDGFPAIRPPALSARHTALCQAPVGLCPLGGARVVDLWAIGERRQGRQAHGKPRAGRGLRPRRGLDLDTAAGLPWVTRAVEGDRLETAINGTMPLAFALSHAVQGQPGSCQSTAIPGAGTGVTGKASARCAAWISRVLTSVYTAEERFAGLLNAAQDVLTSRGIGKGERASRASLLQRIRLIVVVERPTTFLVGSTAFLESGIGEPTGCAKLGFKCLELSLGRQETVLVGLAHVRPSLLVVAGTASRGCRDVPTRPAVVRPTPQGRQWRAQMPQCLGAGHARWSPCTAPPASQAPSQDHSPQTAGPEPA
jgi:hypothetical protein